MCKLGVISQEQLKIDRKLLLSANRKSYVPRRLAQQRMTLIDRFAVRQYRQSRKGVLCDQMVHFSTDLTLWLDSPAMLTPLYLEWSSHNT